MKNKTLKKAALLLSHLTHKTPEQEYLVLTCMLASREDGSSVTVTVDKDDLKIKINRSQT